MKKSIYKKFLDFKTRHNLSNETITQIATEYADSNLELARSHFSDKYNISEHTFYKARDYAIIFCLVDDVTYKKIREKSSTNYRSNNEKNSAVSSIAHFDELLVMRQEYFNGFSNNEILDIGYKYVTGVKIKYIAVAYDTGEYAIKKLLKKGIVELIFDSYYADQINVFARGSLDKLMKQREANKKNLLDCIQNQIVFLKSQIKYYNLYFRNSQNKPDLKSINEELQNAIKMYNETLRL